MPGANSEVMAYNTGYYNMHELSNRFLETNRHTIDKALSRAWHSQLESNRNLPDLTAKVGMELLEATGQTLAFGRMYDECYRYVSDTGTDWTNLQALNGLIAGRVHELASFGVFAGAFKGDDQVLLDSKRTFELFQKLYPDRKKFPVVRSPIGQPTLNGISVPDAMVLRREERHVEVAQVLECTLTEVDNEMADKQKALKRQKLNFPGIFSDAGLIFVIPFDREAVPGVNVRYLDILVSRKEYSTFAQSTIESILDKRLIVHQQAVARLGEQFADSQYPAAYGFSYVSDTEKY